MKNSLLKLEIAHTAYLAFDSLIDYVDEECKDDCDKLWKQEPECRAKLTEAADLLWEVYQKLMDSAVKEEENEN